MSVVPVADVLQGRVAVDSEVTVRGWVRTRRDSKAGISFLAVYDGSCFDPVQAVINNSLPNYNEDVLRLTTGCSVIVTGKVVASPGQGQQFEIQASKVEVAGAHEPGFLLETFHDGFLYFTRKTSAGAKIHQMEARHIKTGG